MKKFEIYSELPDGRCLAKGGYKDLYPDDTIIVAKGDREWSAVVETRTVGGAVARVVMEH